jgi:tetratricopeptide (TPR) repeat protein
LYRKNPKENKKCLSYLKKLIESFPNDVESLIEFATFIEQSDPTTALKGINELLLYVVIQIRKNVCFIIAYEDALGKLNKLGTNAPPPELLNNTGVLFFIESNYKDAEKHISLALESLDAMIRQNSKPSDYTDQIRNTLEFNLARCYEERKLVSEAETRYHSVLGRDKTYLHCKMSVKFPLSITSFL